MAFCRCSVLCLISAPGLATFAAPGGRDQRPVFSVGGEHTVEVGQVDVRLGHQYRQPGDEIERLEDDVQGCTNAASA